LNPLFVAQDKDIAFIILCSLILLSSICDVDTCLRQVKADKASDQGSERSTSPDSTCTHSTISEDLKEASNNFPAKFIEKSAPRGEDHTRNAKVNIPV
jgi:hypothetical protein